MMKWYQVAHDRDPIDGRNDWVVLQMVFYPGDPVVKAYPIGKYPTRHEAEGHAKIHTGAMG
jgi:hypothetical protein